MDELVISESVIIMDSEAEGFEVALIIRLCLEKNHVSFEYEGNVGTELSKRQADIPIHDLLTVVNAEKLIAIARTIEFAIEQEKISIDCEMDEEYWAANRL